MGREKVFAELSERGRLIRLTTQDGENTMSTDSSNRIRWVQFGDSRIINGFTDTYASNRTRNTSTRGTWCFLQAISGHAFRLVNTAGVVGNTIADCNARFDSTVLGAMFSGGTPGTSAPGVKPFLPDIVGVEVDVNDFIVGTPLATMKAEAAKLIERCGEIGAWCVWQYGRTPASGAAAIGYGNTWRDTQLAFWKWLDEQEANYRHFLGVNVFKLTVDPANASGYCLPNLTNDNQVHGNQNSNRIIAEAVWAKLVSRGAVSPADWLPASTAEVYNAATSPNVRNRLSNPVFTGGTAVPGGAGWSGLIPTGWTAAACVNATVIASLVDAPGGIGKALQLDVTWTGAGGLVQGLSPRIESICSAGDVVQFGYEAYARGLNADGVTLETMAASHNVLNVAAWQRWQTASGSSFFGAFGNSTAADGSRYGDMVKYHIFTPPSMPIDGAPTRVDGYFNIHGGALTTGSCRVWIARAGLLVNGDPSL
jgi:hypothetical protein